MPQKFKIKTVIIEVIILFSHFIEILHKFEFCLSDVGATCVILCKTKYVAIVRFK